MAFATKQKPQSTLKKHPSKPRKHPQRELRHYWPYLPLLAIVGAGLLCNMLWPTGSRVLGVQSDLSSASLLSATNQQREEFNEMNLSINSQLNQAAQAKALDMAAGNYWSHNTPDGATPWTFINKAGYSYAKAGENLAYGFSDAQTAITAWMHSPEHRKNMLESGYREVGFGVASSSNYVGTGAETIIVAMYAQPVTGTSTELQLAGQSATSAEVKGVRTTGHPVTRIALLGDNTPAGMPVIVLALTSLAVAIFIIRHGRLLHRSLVRSEVFILHHPFLDVMLVSLATVGFVLSRTSGFIL
jgi:uncharacterized protein YkwD